MSVLLFVLCAFGLTQILAFSKILDPIRPKYHFFHCPMCIGFWVGIILWAASPWTQLFNFDRSIVTALMLGCISSGTSYVLCMLFGDEGIRIEKQVK